MLDHDFAKRKNQGNLPQKESGREKFVSATPFDKKRKAKDMNTLIIFYNSLLLLMKKKNVEEGQKIIILNACKT